MGEVKVLDLKKTILQDNDADADKLREELAKEGTFYVNVMSSPGSGKTTTIKKTLEMLSEKLRAGVVEADIDSDVDAITIQEAGFPAIQAHTGGMCHLDADMSRQALRALGTENLDLVILENVGNLVCPAEFDTGAHRNVVILSVPEGDDKPLKYPLVFETSQAVLINKIDAAPVFDFDMEQVAKYILDRNPNAKIFPVSAVTGEGMDAWCEWLYAEVKAGR
ncbi:MAG: hydrogenase nickel incorporation protein HypB [Lachnospiraceae bacterium]|nr:hydrogenase nickel incorporation protein HypB [Lachnospiraceae bacterium]